MELKQAETIAVATCYKLQPYCTKINIAGSIRRKKKEVKDIEIICLPKSEKVKDLFGGEGEIIRSKKFIETVNSLGKIIKGNANGKYVQIEASPDFSASPGPSRGGEIDHSPFTIDHSPFTIDHSPFTIDHSPFTIHHSPFTIDLFIPDDFDYYRQYAIRTGSAEYVHKVIAAGWKKQGWCGSDKGLRKITDCIEMKVADGKSTWRCINKNAELPPVWQSEEEFFRWIKVVYEKPMHRV